MHRAAVLVLVALLACGCVPEVVRQNERGNTYFAAGAYEEALDAYRRAQVDAPDRAEPYYNAGNAYNRLGRLDETLAQTQQALRSDDAALQARAWYNLGNAYFDAQRWSEAIAAYREALRRQPDDMDAKHNLELALRELEQQRERQSDKQDGNQAEPSDKGQAGQGENRSPSGEPTASPSPQPPGGGTGDEPTPQPADSSQEAERMTPEQARSLLEALLGRAETLQGRFQQPHGAGENPPARDW